MCGIFGYLSRRKPISNEKAYACLRTIAHRGPDGEGLWSDNNIGVWLGHRRLSIIDLDPRSAQPMHDSVTGTTLVFNGEIYNYQELKELLVRDGHQFKTTSDTEVILKGYAQWGKDVLQRLKGMFAIALFDPRTQQVLLARDRMGEKPLFIYRDESRIVFGSELKAMLALPDMPRRVSPEALEHLLAYGYTSRSQCILEGYSKLPPAHAMQIDLHNLQQKQWCYWQAPALEQSREQVSEHIAVQELKEVLSTAVKRQLVADVPVGILLSGGVDSSLVTGLAAGVSSQVNTYNVSFPGTPEDESGFALQIADHFGTKHTVIPAEAASVEWLPMLAKQYDEPMTDQSLIPTYMLCKVVKQHCTVALGGDGADELFGGYNRYQRMIGLQAKAKKMPLPLRKLAASLASGLLPLGFRGRHSILELATDFEQALPVDATLFDREWRNQLMPNLHFNGSAEQVASIETIRAKLVADRAMRTDLVRYMPEDILVKSDRAAMLASLEVRAPFLDVDVVEYALQKVPTSLKVNSAERKILLKRLAAQLLPASYNAARKQGFVPPLDKWLQDAQWQGFFKDVLLTGSDSIFNKAVVERLMSGQQKGQFNKRRIFALLMIALWQKEYRISF